MILLPTHFDFSVAYQGVYFSTIMLQVRFKLNLLELVSVVCALDFSANCPYYFISASVFYMMLPKFRNRSPEDSYGIDVKFGYNFHILCQKIFKKEKDKNIRGVPVLFNRYRDLKESCSYSFTEYVQLVTCRMLTMVYAQRNYPEMPQDPLKAYNDVLKKWQKFAKQAKTLICGNSMVVAANIGLLPSCTRNELHHTFSKKSTVHQPYIHHSFDV